MEGSVGLMQQDKIKMDWRLIVKKIALTSARLPTMVVLLLQIWRGRAVGLLQQQMRWAALPRRCVWGLSSRISLVGP